ncbi:MAG: RHS repeat-associated core domain-containing protein [Anaerolineae bacterium]
MAGQHYEYDAATNVQTKRYYAEGKLLATRSIPNANPNAQTLRYVQSDHLGSTSTLTDANGQVVARERYSAFGERRRGEASLTTDQLYTGQQYNSLSGLYHYSDGKSAGRFYDPLLARFIMADSITPGKGSIPLNRYAYAYNSPLNYSDPGGHDPLDQAWQSDIQERTGRQEPTAEDILVRLFSLAYSEEWKQTGWDAFYDENNQRLMGLQPQQMRQTWNAYMLGQWRSLWR